MNLKKISSSLLLCFFLYTLTSCGDGKKTAIVKGNIKGIAAKVVYLYDVYRLKPIDSARVVDDGFQFEFHSDTVYEPHEVYISIKDPKNKWINLSYIDPYSPEKKHGQFLMEPGTVELYGDLKKSKNITLTGGPQSKFYFQNSNLPYISISGDTNKRKGQVERFLKKVQDMPNAYYAIFALNNIKFEITNEQLKRIYNAFDEQTQQSYTGKKIKEFLVYRPDDGAAKPNSKLIDLEGKFTDLIDTGKRLNMIIFWASWCGPCKAEIPSLKKIATKFKNNDLRMVSVTVDVDRSKWKQELLKQNMPWQQFAIPGNNVNKITAQYNLNYIPKIYFIDNKRNLVKMMGGYSPENETVMEKTITDFLKL